MFINGQSMKPLWLLGLLLIPIISSQCPDELSDISPCKCTDLSGQTKLYCWGDMQLPRLTAILRNLMCGRTIDKFELLGSNITYLPSNLFSRMTVSEINIYTTTIRHFTDAERSSFYGLEDILKSLYMRRCFLTDSLQWQVLSQMYSLSYLDLSYNELTSIPSQWMDKPPPNLRSLLVKGNKISTLEPGALKWMYTLVELDLSENTIISLSRASFPKVANSLIVLRFSYNKLDYIPEDLFDEMLGLRRIYFDNNNITKLEESTWRPIWGDLDTLDLDGNDLQCDEESLWMPKLRPPVRLYGQCAGPNLRGKQLKSLTEDDFES